MKKTLIFALLFIIVITPIIVSQPTMAATCSGVETSIIECDGGGDAGIWHILVLVVEIMSIGIGITALIGILIFGIQYLTAGGDVAKTTKAKRRMLEIVIGLVGWVVIFSFSEWLLPGGKFNFTSDITEISLSLNQSSIEVGKTAQSTVEFTPSDTEDKTYSLSTDNADIVSVIGNSVKCRKEGTATITATSVNGKISTTEITCTKPVEPTNNSNGDNPGSSSTPGDALSKTQLEEKYNSMSTPTYDEVKNLAKSIYGDKIDDKAFLAIMGWTRNENYWEHDEYFNYLCSCAMINKALMGEDVYQQVNNGWYTGIADSFGSKSFLEYSSGYTGQANAAALKTAYLAFQNTDPRPYSTHGIINENGYSPYAANKDYRLQVQRPSEAFYCTNTLDGTKVCAWDASAGWYAE